MVTREENVVNKINEGLAKSINELSNIYHCEQQGEDLIIKEKYTSYDYIFKFKNFTTSLKVNDNLVVNLFTSKKEDIVYNLNHMPNDLLANSKEIIEICNKELERYYIDNILQLFKNKYKYDFYYNDLINQINILKSKCLLLSYYKINGEWDNKVGNELLDCEIEEILEIKEISKELLNKLNNRK